MFALSKDWFTPHSKATRPNAEIPSYEEFLASVEKEVQERLSKEIRTAIQSQPSILSVKDFQLVITRESYDKIKDSVSCIKEKYGNNSEYVEPMLVYHSTQDIDKMNSILKDGYLLPGQQHRSQLWSLRMQNGAAYGDGVYCSPHFDISSWYSFVDINNQIQLIVNVLIAGRTFEHGRHECASWPQLSGFVDERNHQMYDIYFPEKKWAEKSNQQSPPLTRREYYHTLRSQDMAIWVTCDTSRIVPVGVATVQVQAVGPLARVNQIHDSPIVVENEYVSFKLAFSGRARQYFLVQPPSRRHWYFVKTEPCYTNPYTLLLATILAHQKIYWATMQAVMRWMCNDGEVRTPSSFLQLASHASSVRRLNEIIEREEASGHSEGPKRATESTKICWEEIRGAAVEISGRLEEEFEGCVPTDTEQLASLLRRHKDSLKDFWDVVETDEFLCKTGYKKVEKHNLLHYFVVPPSLMAHHAFSTRIADVSDRLLSSCGGQLSVALCEKKLSLFPCANADSILRIYNDKVDSTSTNDQFDSLAGPLDELLDRVTKSDYNDKDVHVIYLFVNKPGGLDELEGLTKKWATYTGVKHISFKVIFLDEVHLEVLKLKASIHTLRELSPNFFFTVKNWLELEDCLNIILDEVEYDSLLGHRKSSRLAVAFPCGVVGEGFLKDASKHPSWDVEIQEAAFFRGAVPHRITTGDGSCYRTNISCLQLDTAQDLELLARCIFELLSAYQTYVFQFPERINQYCSYVQELGSDFGEWIETLQSKNSVARSILQGIKYKFQGFLTSIEVFGGVKFYGKWYSNLRQMKYGKSVARRVKKEFNLDNMVHGLTREQRKRVAEPSDILYFVDRRGLLIRTRISESAKIEPWLLSVEYVSLDEGSSIEMLESAESDSKVYDSSNRLVTDILLMDVDKDDVGKMYCGYVFTRTPYLYIHSQHSSLIVNTLTTCLEKAFSPLKEREPYPQRVTKTIKHIKIVFELLPRARHVIGNEEALQCIARIGSSANLEESFTTKNGIQSVNQVLAMLLLPEARGLALSDRWPRICFGLLSEAVSRNCKARVRAGRRTADQLMDLALGINSSSCTENYKVNIRQASKRTNGFMSTSFTNCSPFKLAASLFFVQFLHENRTEGEICQAFLHGEASMVEFLHRYLPGAGGYVTQLALYLQGLERANSKHNVPRPFGNPRSIVDACVEKRIQHYKLKRLLAEKQSDRTTKRLHLRLAEAEIFRTYHKGLPRLFTKEEVDDLNSRRPKDDQLQVLPTGLLVHHCAFETCPDFLCNFQSTKDMKTGNRHGLMKHLSSDMLLGRYIKGWHKVSLKVYNRVGSSEDFCKSICDQFPKVDDCESLASLHYERLSSLRARGTRNNN